MRNYASSGCWSCFLWRFSLSVLVAGFDFIELGLILLKLVLAKSTATNLFDFKTSTVEGQNSKKNQKA